MIILATNTPNFGYDWDVCQQKLRKNTDLGKNLGKLQPPRGKSNGESP